MVSEEKTQLTTERNRAVRQAWAREKQLVLEGQGTRDWSAEEQRELLETGRVRGYEGQHMKSASAYPEYAGDKDNIQFLTEQEHFEGAHQGDFHNETNGYYDPDTGEMSDFGDNGPTAPSARELSDPYAMEMNDRVGLYSQRESDGKYVKNRNVDYDFDQDFENDYSDEIANSSDLSDEYGSNTEYGSSREDLAAYYEGEDTGTGESAETGESLSASYEGESAGAGESSGMDSGSSGGMDSGSSGGGESME